MLRTVTRTSQTSTMKTHSNDMTIFVKTSQADITLINVGTEGKNTPNKSTGKSENLDERRNTAHDIKWNTRHGRKIGEASTEDPLASDMTTEEMTCFRHNLASNVIVDLYMEYRPVRNENRLTREQREGNLLQLSQTTDRTEAEKNLRRGKGESTSTAAQSTDGVNWG